VPWLTTYSRSMSDMFGDPFPYGVGPNLPTLEAFLRYAFDQGISRKAVSVEELFLAETAEHFKI
jgi:4,5-dihydroxyphthalate decarboxylase